MQGALLLLALAAPPEILLPPWPLSADGELVAVRGEAALVAEGARVEPVSPGLFLVVPAEGEPRVSLSAGPVSAVAAVEPPPGEIRIALLGPPPVKGRDAGVELELALPAAGDGAAADPGPPELVASTGRLRELRPVGPGRFRAVYEPAPTRHPEVLVLVALAPRCPLCTTPRAVGHLIVPLAAAIELPGRSEPGVRTTVTIAGRRFGPVVASAAGRFSLPVLVPPGARRAIADTVDGLGNRSRRELDLRLPPVDRLACTAWPRALPADGRSAAGIWCVASTEAGTAAEGARIGLAADLGSVRAPAPFRGALQRGELRAAPGRAGATEVTVRATCEDGGPPSSDELRLALAAGAPAEIVATLALDPVPLGAEVAADTAVRDANGTVLGRPSGPPGAASGFVASDRFVARSEAGDYAQDAPLSFALPPGAEVARLALRREGAHWVAEARTVDARPAAGVPLRFGSGATASTDARGEARVPAEGPQETVRAGNGARAAGWQGILPPAAPIELARTIRVALRPPSPVDVVARVEGGFVRWRVEERGRPVPARAVSLRAADVVLGRVEPDGAGGRAAVRSGRGPVAVVDEATGVAAIVEVP